MDKRPDPTTPAADAERAMAQNMLSLPHAALSYIGTDGLPGISRIALGRDDLGAPLTLISALAPHFAGLRAHPACALMVGEPGQRGDPLTHPRLMLRAKAEFAAPQDRAVLRAIWLAGHPKAELYIDFADFAFVRLHPVSALLNAGFAKAFTLTPDDLAL